MSSRTHSARAHVVGASLALALSASACHSAGTYGHSKVYAPTSDERAAIAGAVEYDPVEAQRFPDKWKSQSVWLFGVVTNRGTGPGGKSYLELSLRSLEPRNLCSTAAEETCRVTVGDREHGKLKVLVDLAGDDDVGEHRVGGRSLLRVVGRLTGEVDPVDGTPMLAASFVRHWPRDFYVTSRAASVMLR